MLRERDIQKALMRGVCGGGLIGCESGIYKRLWEWGCARRVQSAARARYTEGNGVCEASRKGCERGISKRLCEWGCAGWVQSAREKWILRGRRKEKECEPEIRKKKALIISGSPDKLK